MANMFSGNQKKTIPRTFEECYREDDVSSNLWLWGERIERFGKILLVILIIIGVVLAISTSITEQQIEQEGYYYTHTVTQKNFDSKNFFGVLFDYAVYAFIDYCAYHALALLICALASIVQNTNISANIALFNSNVCREKINADSAKPSSRSAGKTADSAEPNPGSADKPTDEAHKWRCNVCGNMISTSPCPHCGCTKRSIISDAPYYCGNCGKDGPFETDTCPNCGSSIRVYNN